MRASRALGVGVALAAAGCSAGWERHALDSPTPLAARQQVQVWHGGHASLLHGLRIDSIAVSGIPYHKPLSCDSCLVVIPRAEVDSLRTGDLSMGLWRSVALVGGVIIVSGIVYCLPRDCRGT
jgi:hypothetical protein